MKILLLEFRNETTWLCDIIVLEIEYISSWWLEKDERLLRNKKRCIKSSISPVCFQQCSHHAGLDKERGHCALCANLCDHYHVTTYIVDFQWAIDIWVPKRDRERRERIPFFLISKNRNFITMIIIGCIYYFVNQ